tara:strand:+ start:2507 stop:2827 length:321 start_codon:yes stop_codon:yes gene_type:complete
MMNMKSGYKAGGKAMKYQAGGMPMAEGSTGGAPGVLDPEEMQRANTGSPMPPGAMDRMDGPTPEQMRKMREMLKEKKKKKKKVGMKSGGNVRGYGMARRGKPCKMR